MTVITQWFVCCIFCDDYITTTKQTKIKKGKQHQHFILFHVSTYCINTDIIVLQVSGLNNIIVLAYMLGVPPDTLAEWYYGDKLKEIKKGLKES